jgi:hypothetical protein
MCQLKLTRAGNGGLMIRPCATTASPKSRAGRRRGRDRRIRDIGGRRRRLNTQAAKHEDFQRAPAVCAGRSTNLAVIAPAAPSSPPFNFELGLTCPLPGNRTSQAWLKVAAGRWGMITAHCLFSSDQATQLVYAFYATRLSPHC